MPKKMGVIQTIFALVGLLSMQIGAPTRVIAQDASPSSVYLPLIMGGQSTTAAVQAAGAPGPKSKPHLRFAKPLHGRNPLLNSKDDEGDEATTISVDPALSALCQSYIGNPNPYANPAPNVDMIVNDTVVGVGSQTGCSAAQNETTIAVNPGNPNNLVAGTNDYRVFNTRESRNDSSGWAYTTLDGGATWTNVQLPHLAFHTGATGALSDMDGVGDPAVAFGPNHTVYYANISFSRLNDGNAIVVSKSSDGGLTWGEPSIVQIDGADSAGNPLSTPYFNDKEWITVDPNNGTVYVTWTRFGPSDSPIVMSKSTDGGATWSSFAAVNPGISARGITAYSQGSIPQVGRNGELYIAYESAVCQTLACDQPNDHDAIIMAKSTDGGVTFKNLEVAADYDFPLNNDVGDTTLTGENFRINSFPQFAIDRQTGRLYVTWADDRNGQYAASGSSIRTNGDVLVTTSSNGTQWTQLYQLGTHSDEVFPAIAAYNARVVVTFYTRTYDPNGIGLDYAYTDATGLGKSKQNNVTRITTQSANPQVQFVSVGAVSGQVLQGVFIGDYTAVALGSDFRFHPAWTDFRGKPGATLPNQDAYTQAISLH
jgi:hypothetical protein